MYKSYVKKKLLKAVRFRDDFETYKFICKEVKWYTDLAETEAEYHQVKKFGIGVNGTEANQRLFIGDYLADGGNGDFYVIRKEFMAENYDCVGLGETLQDTLEETKKELTDKEFEELEDKIKTEKVDGYEVFIDEDDNAMYFQNMLYLPHQSTLATLVETCSKLSSEKKDRDLIREYELLSKYDRIEIEYPDGTVRTAYVDKAPATDTEEPKTHIDNNPLGIYGNSFMPLPRSVVSPTLYRNRMLEENTLWDPPRNRRDVEDPFGRVIYQSPSDRNVDVSVEKFVNPVRNFIETWINGIENMNHVEDEPSNLFKIRMTISDNRYIQFKYFYNKDGEITARDVLIDCINKIDTNKLTGTTGDIKKDNRISGSNMCIQLVQYINEVIKYAHEKCIEIFPFENAPVEFILGPNEAIHGLLIAGSVTIEINNIENLLNIVREGDENNEGTNDENI